MTNLRKPKIVEKDGNKDQKESIVALGIAALIVGIGVFLTVFTYNFMIMFFSILAAAVFWIAKENTGSKSSDEKSSETTFKVAALIFGLAILFSVLTYNFLIMFFGILPTAVFWIAKENTNFKSSDEKSSKFTLIIAALIAGLGIFLSIFTGQFMIMFFGIIASAVFWIAKENADSKSSDEKSSKFTLIIAALIVGLGIFLSIFTGQFMIMFFGIIASAVFWIAKENTDSFKSYEKNKWPTVMISALIICIAFFYSIFTGEFLIVFIGIIVASIIWTSMGTDLSEFEREEKKESAKNKTLERETVKDEHESFTSLEEIKNEVSRMKKAEMRIETRNIETALDEGDLEEAQNLLKMLKENYDKYKKAIEELETLEDRKSSLAEQLADGEIDKEIYDDAARSVEQKKAYLEERLTELRQEVIREDYEKPF